MAVIDGAKLSTTFVSRLEQNRTTALQPTDNFIIIIIIIIIIINKKDGYRQQNVRQRQKLISIIDYDVCILEYLQPFWRFSTSKNEMTPFDRSHSSSY